MANSKFKATAELFLDTSNAKNDAKKFVTDLKQQLNSIETAADKMNVFKELVGYIGQVDNALTALRTKNGDAFKHMFDGVDENFRKQFEDLFELSGDNLQRLDVLREKLATLTPKSGIAEIRKFATELNKLFTSIGADAPLNIDEFKNKATQGQIDNITSALGNFEDKWVEIVSRLKDGFNTWGMGTGGLSESVQNEIKKLQDQISELKSLKKELNSILSAKKDYDAFNPVNLEVDLSNIKELIEKYKELDLASKNLQKGTKEYYDNLTQRAKIGLQLSVAQESGKLNGVSSTDIRKIIDSDSFSDVLSEFESSFKNISAVYDQTIEKTQQKIQNIKNKAVSGAGQGDGRQLLKTYEELLKIVDKLSAFSMDELDFNDENVVALIKTLKDLYATEEQFGDVDDIVQGVFDASLTSTEGLEKLKALFGIEIPDSIQTAEEKYQSFLDKIKTDGFADEFSAGEYLSEMESLRSELQSLYEQGRITEDQFNEINNAFDDNVKGQVNAFKNKSNMLKELNDLNKQASQTNDKDALDNIIQKRREILDTAEQNRTLTEEQLAEEKAITDEIEKRIGVQKQERTYNNDTDSDEAAKGTSNTEQENEEYQRLLVTINQVKAAVDAKTDAFMQEQSTVDSVVNQEIASLTRLKEYLDLLKETAQNIFSGSNKRIGFHYGNLEHYAKTGDKSENFKYQGDSLRTGNWGSFGTGVYYLSNPNAFVGSSTVPQGKLDKDKKFYAIDLSKYNLYMAQTSEQAESLYNFLNKLQKFVMSASNYRGFDKELDGVNVDSLYKEFQTVFKNVSLPIEALQNFIDKMRNMVAGLDIDKDWATFDGVDEVLGGSDNIPTRFMKSLGYQGVDVRGTGWDKLQHGNVVYDLDQANAYYKTFDNLDELLEYYNQNLTQTNSIQDTINNSVAQWQKNLDAILTTVNSISTSARDSSSVMQSMADEMSKITTDAKTLETIPDIIGNLSSSLDPLVNSLHQMVNDAQSIRDALNGINGGFDQQTTSAFNVKFDDGLIASISNNIDSILDVVGDIANKIDANDSKKALVEAMKSNLTQIFKYVSDFNNKKNANMDYQKQELSMSVLSDGSISTNFGEKGRVPWDRVATSLISNLSKTLLMDIHSHPLETFINGDRHTSDSFSGANGDIGAMNFSKKLGSQLFSMITGNVMRVIDISKLTSQELNNLKIALADVEKEYAAMPEYSRYVSYDNDTGVQGYFMQDNLSEQHMVSDIFEKELYEAFSRIGYSKDFVDDKLFQKYNLTDDEQLTALAKRLVDLELAATSTLSPVERLSQIISQFGGDVTSDNAKTLLKGFEKGEVDAVDAFNQLNGWNYKTSQDAINSLLTIDSVKEMTTTESLLAQIVGVLEGIKSNITNIENNTRLDTSRQLDQAINDLAGIRQYALDNSIMYGYDGIDERMISNIDSGINIHNISSYNADEVYELAKQKKEDFSYFMHDLSSYSSNTDIMRMLERFKDTWKTINDALKVVELNNTRTGNDMIDPDTGVVARSELLDMREELINPVNISKLIDSLVKLKDATSTENRELQSAENIRSQDTSLQEIQNILNQIYGVLQGFTGIKAKDQDSVEVKKPIDESRLNQDKFSEQDLSVLGSILDAVNGINNYLTSNKYNSASEGIDTDNNAASNIYTLLSSRLSQNLASERTLSEAVSLINLLLDKSKLEKDLATKATQYNDLQSFIRDNVPALKAIGVNNNESAMTLWRNANYSREDFQPIEIAMEDAVDVIRNKVPENILDGWFRNADSGYKPKLENIALTDKDVRNAALNIMWDNYKQFSGKDIDFSKFLYSNIPVYRGKNQENYTDDDKVLSFTFDRSVAESFGKHILETVIRPIDTIGSYQTTAEGEVMVRKDYLDELPEFQTWLNNMSSGLKESFVQATSETSDIGSGSDYALEATLQSVKSVLESILNRMDATEEQQIKPDVAVSEGSDNIIPDEQDGSGYALETTLQSVVTILNNILTGISISDELSAFTQPLSDAVVALKNVADGIIQHQKAQKSDTRVAQARIEDPAQQDVIRQKAIDTGLKLGSDVQIATLDSLTNGLVRVSGAFKNADGEWEGFTVKVNEANEAVDLAINKQSAFAKSLNKTSEQMADDSNPYVYSKDEVEARAQKHIDEYAAQGKNATVQFKDSGRYTITILEEIDGLSKQIFQTFDENDDKIERTTVTMSNSQKMKLDALQKKLIDNGLSSGLISDKDQIYADYQKASDELNNMTDAYSKLDDVSDDQISKWKQQIALVQQLGSQLTDLINQKKLESDKKIFESDRSKKLSKFDLDRTKLYKDISVPDSFKGQINDSRKAIETAADSDALKVAINNWEALKNKINEVAVQQDLYIKKTNAAPDSFSKDLSVQEVAFDQYKKSIEGAFGVTDELKTKIQALETELKSVNDGTSLSEWQKKFKDLQADVNVARDMFKKNQEQQSEQIRGDLNSKLKEAGLNKSIKNPSADQQEILNKKSELIKQLNEYDSKVKYGQQAEISGIEQTKTALFGLIDAYKQKNNIVNANGNPSKQAYGTAQLLNQGAKYNSLVSRAQGVDLTGDFDAVKKLTDAYDKLKEAQSKFKIGEDLTTESGKAKVEAFKQAQIEFNRYAQELGKVVKEEEKLVSNSTNDGTPVAEDFQNTEPGRKKALEDLVNSIPEAAIGKFNSDFTELTYTVKNGDGTFTTFTATLNAAGTTIYATAGETEKATTAFGRFFDELKNKAKGIATYLISMTGFQEIFQQIRQGIQYVIEIDSALTELKKVTDETDSTYDSFLQNMSKTASVVGSTVSELTTMAAEWARLGYSIEDSAKLAESTAILLNVSEFDNATEASKALISTMQAFSYTADESQHVVDILNEVGNNYAVSSDGLATALQDSASALMEGGNNLEQSVALIAAANKVVQDPNSVGSALRTISLRLRGTSVDVLEEMGEETDGVITSVSKLQSKIKALSGVNILTESGDYKDTYTILKEIGQVWEDMNDIDQAALLELMAGKNRANTLSAILGNMGDLTSAYETAMNAEGSALRENATYMDSIQGRIDQFKNAVQTMWMNFIDSDVIKFIVNVGTALVKLVDKIGVLQSALTVFLTYKSIFSKKKIDFASILGIHDKKDRFVFGKQGLSKSIVNLVGNIKNKLSGIKIGDNIGGDIADNILNTDDVAVSAEEFASAIKNNIENYATINTSEIDSKIDDIQNKLATAREQLNNAKAADWDYYKSMGSVTPAEDRDTRIQEKTQEVKELETQLTNLQEQRNSMMSSVANDTAGSILEQVDEEREGYESIFSVLSEIKDVKLSIGDEQDAAKKIDEITEAAKNGQSALANYMQGLDDSDVALKAYVASVDDGNYSLTGFQQFIQQHNAGLQQSTFNAYASAAAHAALNAALSMGLSLLISFVVSGISKLINAEKEAAEAAKEATKDAEKLSEEFSSLDDYKKQIKELRKSLDSNNLSQSEAYDARQKLLTIQDELISKFGLEKEGINLVTGAIEDQIGAIDELEKKDAQDWVYSNQKAINDAVKYFDDEDKFGRGFLDFGVAFRNWGVTEDVYNKVAKYINSREHMSQRGRSEGEHDIYFEGSAEEVKSEVEAFEKWLDAYEDELRDELKVEQSESRREKLEKDISQLEDYREDLSTFKNDNFGEDSTYATNKALIAEAQEKTAIAKYTDQYMEILQIQDDFLEAQTKGDKNGMRDALDAYHAATAAAKEDATESYMDEFFDGLDGKFATEEFELNLTADDSKLKKNIQSVINDSGLFKLDNNQIKDMVSKGLNVEGAIDESNTYTDDQIQGLIKLQSEADNAGISIETLISILTNFGLINGKPAEAMADNIRSVGKAYSVLSSEAEKYKDINEILGESVYDGVELSKDQYEALSELIGSEEEFIDCVDTSDGYIVKNVELTKKLIDGKKEELATETKLAKSQAQLKYHDLVRSLGDVVSSTMVFSEENDAAAESILNEIATIKKAINQYQLLENSLLGVTNAFEDFASAQELDSQNTYGDSYVEMAQTMYDAIYKTGEVGTEAFWAAVRANVPSDIYADLAPGKEQIRAIADYLNQNVFSTLTLSDESFSIDYSAIEDFIENAQDVGIFTGTDASVFGLSANFLNSLADGEDALQAFADKIGMTKTQVYAMLSEMDKYNADGIGLSMLLQLDDSTAGQITLVTNELERLYTERKALLEQGASDDVLKENEADIAAATSQLAELEKQSEQTVVEYAAIKNAMADTSKYLKDVMPEEIITRLDLDGKDTVENQMQKLKDILLGLEEPTVIDLENTKRAIEELEKVDPEIEAHVKLNDNGLYEIVDGDDYTGEVDLRHYIELKNTESFIDASLKNGLTTTESLLSEIAENTAVMAGKESGSNEPEDKQSDGSESTSTSQSDGFGGADRGQETSGGDNVQETNPGVGVARQKDESVELPVVFDIPKALSEAYKAYKSDIDEFNKLEVSPFQTTFGNIDTNNRQILEWTNENLGLYKDALESWYTDINGTQTSTWDQIIDDLRGTSSTVFGASSNFDGVEIAFSPMLQTENGAVLLDKQTVDEYIYGLIDKAGEGWTKEDLLSLDTEGLEVDGQKIKCLIADVGDTAIQTGEAMHYVGADGSIVQNFKVIEDAAKEAGISVEDMMYRLRNTEGPTMIFPEEIGKTIDQLMSDIKKEQDELLIDTWGKGTSMDQDQQNYFSDLNSQLTQLLKLKDRLANGEDPFKIYSDLYSIQGTIMLDVEVDKDSAEEAGEAAVEAATAGANKGVGITTQGGVVNPKSFKSTSVKSYSQLQSDVASFNDMLSQTEEIIGENTEVSQEYHDALVKMADSKEDVIACFGDETSLVVKDTKALDRLVKLAKKNTTQNIKLAKSQARLEYYDLVKQLDSMLDSTDELTDANFEAADSLLSQINSVQRTIQQYQMLEESLLGAANAFKEFDSAKEIDSQNTYGDSFVEMAQTMYDAYYKTGEVGSEAVRAAVEALIDPSVYAGLERGSQEYNQAIYDAFNSTILPTLTLNDDSLSIDFENIEKFVIDGLGKIFTGTGVDSFDLVDDLGLDEAAEKMNMTTTQLYAMLAALKMFTGRDFLSEFDDDSISGRIMEVTSNIEDLNREKLALLQDGVTEEEQARIDDINKALEQNKQELQELGAQAYSTWQEYTQTDVLLAKLDEVKDKSQKMSDVFDNDFIVSLGLTGDETVQQAYDTLLAKKTSLEEPVALVAQLAIENIDEQIKKLKDGDYTELSAELNLEAGTVPTKEQIQQKIDALNEDKAKLVVDFGIELPEEDRESIQSQLDAIEQFTINDKTFTVTGNTSETMKRLNAVRISLNNLKNKTITVTTNHVSTGTTDVNGTAHVNGTAFKNGSWGVPRTETALVGELGEEMLVRDGRWYTVGENGAEFTDVRRGDIIFNHKQTADLLSKGYVTGRGKAFAEGTAYSSSLFKKAKSIAKKSSSLWRPKKSSSSGSSNKKSSSKSSSSNSAEDTAEIFDWFEVLLEEINEQLDLMNAKLENAVSISAKNSLLDQIINVNKNKLSTLKEGLDLYTDYSNKLLREIPEKYRKMAQDGAVAIEEFAGDADKETLEAINNYRDWAQKVADLAQQMEELNTEISTLAKQKIDNIAEGYDNKKSIRDSKIDQYEAYNSLLETDVGFESEKIYQAMMSENKSNINILQKQRDAMLAELNKQVEAGNIKKYSQDWYDVVNDISAVDTEIIELKTDIEDYQDSINELHWDKFDLLMDKLNAVSDEADSLIDVLSSKDLVNKDTAEWTDEGITTLGLYAQKMDAAEVQAKKYEEQINYLNKNWKKLGYTEQEYIDKLDELKSGQYDAIKAYNDTKDAIVDLNKERVEAIKTIIQDEIDAYTELINKKKEELDSEKDLYDFQKSVSEKQKDIAKIQRQLAALAGDNSASAKAKRAQLEAELLDAQADLEETYYDRSVSNQQEALDKELESFEDAKNDEMEGWDEYLENTNKVVADSLDVVKANTNAIYQELQTMGQEYGLSITESLISPWKEGENAIQAFSEKFGLAMSATVDELKKLELEFMETMEKIEKSGSTSVGTVKNNATGYQSAEYKPPKQEESSGGGSSSGSSGGGDSGGKSYPYGKASETSGNIKEGARGNQVKAIQYALNQLGYGNSGTKSVDGKFGSGTKSAVRAFQKAMGISADGIVGKNTRAKFRAKGYKFGTTGVDTDQFAWIDEMGLEEIVLHAQDGKLAYLTKGSAVLPHSISENLMKLGQLDPQYMLDINRPQASVSPSIINNTMELSVDNSIGTLISIENFDGNNPDEITKVVNKALEQHTKNLNNALRKFAR